jgi:hypothetical protein
MSPRRARVPILADALALTTAPGNLAGPPPPAACDDQYGPVDIGSPRAHPLPGGTGAAVALS